MSFEISGDLYPVFATFRDETMDIRAEITADLLMLEGGGEENAGVFERLARNAHTLKGNSASLGLEDAAALMHAVESLLTAVVGGVRRFDPPVIDAMLLAVDEVLRRSEDILANRPDTGAIAVAQERVDALLVGVDDAITMKLPTLSTPAPAPTPGEELLKIGASQFEGFSQVVDELSGAGARVCERAAESAVGARALRDFARRAGASIDPELAAELQRLAQAAEILDETLRVDAELIACVAEELRGGLQMLQLVQASAMLDPLRRAVHDHARRVEKEVLLEIVGAEASVDRRLLGELRGAIAHLLRNAVDHGIEAPADRVAAGKPARARIRLELSVDVTHLTLAVIDDGRGLDAARVRETAVARGLATADACIAMSDEAALALIWLPGFSTSIAVTGTSGRGLGLDAVSDCVTRLGGRSEATSVRGAGTTFRLRVPLSQHLRGRT